FPTRIARLQEYARVRALPGLPTAPVAAIPSLPRPSPRSPIATPSSVSGDFESASLEASSQEREICTSGASTEDGSNGPSSAPPDTDCDSSGGQNLPEILPPPTQRPPTSFPPPPTGEAVPSYPFPSKAGMSEAARSPLHPAGCAKSAVPIAPESGCGCRKCLVEGGDAVGGKAGGGESGLSGGSSAAGACRGVDQLLEAAERAVEEDRFDDASDALRRAARAAPDNAEIFYRAGVCAINQGRWSRALRLWRDGLALCPEHGDLKLEAEKYRAFAFWLNGPRGGAIIDGDGRDCSNSNDNVDDDHHHSGDGIESGRIGERDNGGSESRDDRVVIGNRSRSSGSSSLNGCVFPPFSSPQPPPPPRKSTAEQAPVLGGKRAATAAAEGVAAEGRGAEPEATAPSSPGADGQAGGRFTCSSAAAREAIGNLDVEYMGGDGEWVCMTRAPPLSASECAAIVKEAEDRAAAVAAAAAAAADADARRSGGGGSRGSSGGSEGWGTSRHYAVPTTDVAVRDLPLSLALFNDAMRTRIGPTVAAAAALGDGSAFVGTGAHHPHPHGQERGSAGMDAVEVDGDAAEEFLRRLRVHDAFVVRYDAAAQRSLPLHTDQGELSLTIPLNGADEYEGGGTWFEGLGRAVRA
ncbi:unnamed protein product, partial [Scytosiphon promiscuus]